MKILVARISEEGSHYKGCDPEVDLTLESDPLIKSFGGVTYVLYAQVVSGELVVRGSLSAEVELRCARCSEFFSTTVEVSDFLRAYPAPDGTDMVDIAEDLRDEILLHVPGFAVCSEDCKGICSQCGTDLNDGSCSCEKSNGPSPWSALDEMSL